MAETVPMPCRQKENPEPNLTDPWFYLRGLQQFSFCDWPELISCVLFLGGCNLACQACHNKQLAQNFRDLPCIPKNYVFDYLHARRSWLDGIVLSGGEPTCCPGLDCMLQELAIYGLPIKLDTNGLDPEQIRYILQRELVQLIAVDIKGPWSKYPLLCGDRCSPAQAQEALERIFALAADNPGRFYFRCTKVPALDSIDIKKVQSYLPRGFRLHLQTFILPHGQETSSESRISSVGH